MRKILISGLIFVFLSATAFASDGKGVQNRHGILSGFNPEICNAVSGTAKVHKYGARFTFTASGCTPGHVITLWAFVDDAANGLLNCGGGVVLPNGQFRTTCDVPKATIAECQDCAQVLVPGVLADPRNSSFFFDMLTHNGLVPERALSQIRTVNTCSPDQCETITFVNFPAP